MRQHAQRLEGRLERCHVPCRRLGVGDELGVQLKQQGKETEVKCQ